MSEQERESWNRRYAEGDYVPRTWPSPFLEAWIDRVPTGRALDLACGTGRNALHLAAAGFEVTALDISEVAIERARAEAAERGLTVDFQVADLDEITLPAGVYSVITMFRYLNRRLWGQLPPALRRDGWMILEHHFASPIDVGGPQDPAFRLDPQELLHAFSGIRVLHFSETVDVDRDGGRYALQRFVGCAGDPGW